jgi:hypothetical protein
LATNLKNRKPRQGQAQPSAGSGGDGRPLTPGDNSRAIKEAQQAQLLSYIARLRAQQIPIDEAKAVLAEAKAQYDETMRLAGVAGFKKFELKELLEDLGAKRRDLTDQEQRRTEFRNWLGLPAGKSDEQLDLEARMPATARDEAFWRGDGYTAGLRGDVCQPPADTGVHGQAWMEEWGRGQAKLALSLSPKPAATAAVQEREKTPAELKAEEKRVKAALEALPSSGQVPPHDGFEASPEELQGQVGRQVIQQERGAETEAEEVVG